MNATKTKILSNGDVVDTSTGEVMQRSILPAEMSGVVFITGYRGIGKSFLASTADAPSRIAYLDLEEKAQGIDSQLHFGMYRSLTSESAGRGALGLWEVIAKAIAEIPRGTTVCVLDNIAPLELALRAEAGRDLARYVKEFGLNYNNVMAGRYGGMSSVVNFLITEKVTAPIHARGVKLIIVTAHVKPRWENGVQLVNKFNVKGADRWQELSILTLVLHPGDNPPVPAALVQKEQLGTLTYDPVRGEHTMQRRLPIRIPRCTFAEIRRYLREPADLEHPAPGERPTDAQSDPFKSELNSEQIAMMQSAMRVAEKGGESDSESAFVPSEPEPLDENTVKVRTLQSAGKSVLETAKELGMKAGDVASRRVK